MSVRVMSMIFDRYQNGGGEKVLALALADHCHDDGTRIFPSIKLLAHKSNQSQRTVQYQLRKMEKSGWLIRVSDGFGGRNKTTEYCINPAWIKGAEIAPFSETERVQILHPLPEKGCNPAYKRVQSGAEKGAIAIAPEPSVTIMEPSGKPAATSSPPAKIFFDPKANKLYIDEACYEPWEQAFPGLDLDAEIDKAELWLKANPKKRKKNYEKFLFGWFSRAKSGFAPQQKTQVNNARP